MSAVVGIEERVSALYINGWSIRQIAEAENRSYQAVRGILLRNGVTLRGRGGDTQSEQARARQRAVVYGEVTR